MPGARDVYAEGALIFPCVRVQIDRRDVEDIIRMCRRRIRVPDQWYGDYLATLGAARIGERRLKELCEQYGAETISAFIREWFDYSERRMVEAVRRLPAGELTGRATRMCHKQRHHRRVQLDRPGRAAQRGQFPADQRDSS
jgi:N-methylhydantoinase B